MNKNLLMFIACFIAPIVAATMALKFSWFSQEVASHGEFLDQHLIVDDWPQNEKKWTIAMVQLGECDVLCQQRKATVTNVHDVLGKHKSHVGLINISDKQLIQESIPFLLTANTQLRNDELYLIDHRGLVVLRYTMSYPDSENRYLKKGLIKDLKKLLNYSRSKA